MSSPPSAAVGAVAACAVPGRPLARLGRAAGFEQRAHQQVGIGRDRQVNRLIAEGILGPAVVQGGVGRAGDDPGRRRMPVSGRRGDRPGQVDPVQADDQVRVADQRGGLGRQEQAGRVRVQPVGGREHRPGLEVGDHQRAVPFRQRDPAIPVLLIAAQAAEQEQRAAGLAEELRRGRDRDGIGAVRPGRPILAGVGDRRRRGQRLLLQAHVEAHVGRRGRRFPGDRVRAGERVQGRLDRAGLIVPLGVRPDQRALVTGGVDPVDPGPPPGRVDRAGGADDQHRHPVAVRVVDGHARVHQADVAVDRDRQRLPGHLRVAVRDRDRVLLVQADEQLRITVAVVVDEAVVEASVAGAGNERDVGQAETAQQLCQRVAAPFHRDIAARDTFGIFCPHVGPPTETTLGMPTLGDQLRGCPVTAHGFCVAERGGQ